MLHYPQRLNGKAEVSCIEEQLLLKNIAFTALRKENMDCEQNVEDYKIKLSERYSVKDKTMLEHTTYHIIWYYYIQ